MEKYIPDIYQRNIYTIDYQKLALNGIKCLLFDLDNTIAPYTQKEPDQKVIDLFNNLKERGFKVAILTNSTRKRVEPFEKILNVECKSSAKKPSTKCFNEIIDELKFNISEVAIIGDQILTDVVGGNKIGITTILTTPLSKQDFFATRIGRILESIVIYRLSNKNLFFKGNYYE